MMLFIWHVVGKFLWSIGGGNSRNMYKSLSIQIMVKVLNVSKKIVLAGMFNEFKHFYDWYTIGYDKVAVSSM